jgi:methylmalonyl-CoA mutase cobalamin-binding subunit
MLGQLLAAEGFDVVAEGAASLTSELVERVAETSSDLVVISILPPISPRNSRLLVRRLRDRYSNLPIVMGFWNSAGMKESLAPAEDDSATKLATTLAEAVALIRNTAAQLRLVQEEPRIGPAIHDAAG